MAGNVRTESSIGRRKRLLRLHRLGVCRDWMTVIAITGGLFTMVMAIAPYFPLVNPKQWSSIFAVVSAAGMMEWAVRPFAVFSAVLFAIACALGFYIERAESEV